MSTRFTCKPRSRLMLGRLFGLGSLMGRPQRPAINPPGGRRFRFVLIDFNESPPVLHVLYAHSIVRIKLPDDGGFRTWLQPQRGHLHHDGHGPVGRAVELRNLPFENVQVFGNFAMDHRRRVGTCSGPGKLRLLMSFIITRQTNK